MAANKIRILKDGINNSLMLIYKEYIAMGYDDKAAKVYTSKIIAEYLNRFSINGTIESDMKNMIDKLLKKRSEINDESECAKIYAQIETLTAALEIIKEVKD